MVTATTPVEDVLSTLRQRLDRHAGATADPLLRAEIFLQQLRPNGAQPGVLTSEGAVPTHRQAPADEDALEDVAAAASDWDWVARIQAVAPMPRHRQVECALEIEAGVLAAAVLDGTESTEVRCSEQELHALVAQGAKAYEEMTLGNLRLVLHWARLAARGDAQALQENFQEGCFGLFRAIQGWDGYRGYTFSTYASWQLRQAIERGRANRGSTIRIPVHVQDSWAEGRRSGADMPVLAAYAWDLVTSLQSWEQIKDDPDWDRASLFDTPLEDVAADDVERSYLVFGLQTLSSREQEVLRLRHGLDGEPRMTLDEIGQLFGVTRERIRQIESKALRRLRVHWIDLALHYQDFSEKKDGDEADALLNEAQRLGSFKSALSQAASSSEREKADLVASCAGRVDPARWHA